jgi:hypothetical protein
MILHLQLLPSCNLVHLGTVFHRLVVIYLLNWVSFSDYFCFHLVYQVACSDLTIVSNYRHP